MYYFIVNPASRSGKGMEVWKQAEKILLQNKFPYQVSFTKYPGHGRKLAAQLTASPQRKVLIVIGGDGTFNEVLNGLSCDYSFPVTYLPVGSGNDLARGMHLSSDFHERFSQIMNKYSSLAKDSQKPSSELSMDTGEVQVHGRRSRFAISCGIGYDAAICYEVSHTPVKKWMNRIHLGKLVYAYEAVRMLFSFQPCDMDVELDGNRRYHFSNVYFIAGMNLPCEGGGFHFCPNADCQDGVLDYIVVHNLSKWKILLLFPTAYFGRHTRFKGITLLKGTSMTIHSKRPCVLHRDGEYAGTTDQVTFAVQKHSLRFIR